MNARGGAGMLLAVALALLVTGFAGSMIYWVASGGEAFLAVQEDYREAIAAAAVPGAAHPEPLTQADRQWQRVNRAARLVEVHAHLLFLCIFLVLFALLLNGSQQGGRGRGLAWLASGGVFVYPVGLALQAAGVTVGGQVLSAVGAVMILSFAGVVLARLLCSRDRLPDAGGGPSRR